MCKWLSVGGGSPEGTVPLIDSDRPVIPLPPSTTTANHPTTSHQPALTNILIVIEFLGRLLCDGRQIGRERERMRERERDGDRGRRPRMKMEEDGVAERLEQ